MDGSFRSQQPPTSNCGIDFQRGKTKETLEPHCRYAQETPPATWRAKTPLEGRSRKEERVVEVVGIRVIFTIIILVSSWLIFSQQVATAPNIIKQPWRVHLQYATKDELMLLTGIGTSLADRIMTYRETNIITNAQELQNIHGIGPIKVERLKRTIVNEEDSK